MSKPGDVLPGTCPACGKPSMMIDTAGMDEPLFWAYCWQCDFTCCAGPTADAVAAVWARELAARASGP